MPDELRLLTIEKEFDTCVEFKVTISFKLNNFYIHLTHINETKPFKKKSTLPFVCEITKSHCF